jgi:hypothetical protein
MLMQIIIARDDTRGYAQAAIGCLNSAAKDTDWDKVIEHLQAATKLARKTKRMCEKEYGSK